jgi:predicted transcriptional regulator
MAIIIYHIQRREHRLDEIVEELEIVENKSEITNTVHRMEAKGLLVKNEEVYRIAPKLGSSQTNAQRSMNEF